MFHDTWASEYETDGCVRVRGLLSPVEVQQVRKELDRYIRDVLPTVAESDRTFEADGKNVRNLWRLDRYDPFFKELGNRPDILEHVSQLLNGEAELVAAETFNKPSKIGSGVPHHQDNAYFCRTPADMLTIWIAIDAATMENGPIYYVKGSHKKGMVPHVASGVKGNSMYIKDPPAADPNREFCGTLNPGDALIHHCQTIHYSGPNQSPNARCGLLMVYRGKHTTTDPALKDAYTAANTVKKAG